MAHCFRKLPLNKFKYVCATLEPKVQDIWLQYDSCPRGKWRTESTREKELKSPEIV